MTRSNDGPVISTDRLRVQYGAREVLRDVSLRVLRGEFVALLGPNGAGKSTTLEVLEGFRGRSAGDVRVLGLDPARRSEASRARVGVVLQAWQDHSGWRTRDLLRFQAAHYGAAASSGAVQPWKVEELLAAVGLIERADDRIGSLSGGQRRRLDLAIALVGRPEVLLLDEPTAGLDPGARAEFHELLTRMRIDRETTILMTTHDLTEADRFATRIVVLADGRVIAEGTSAQLGQQIAGPDEVRWTQGGRPRKEFTFGSTAFVRALFDQFGDTITELEVRRSSLERTYLALVKSAEATTRPASVPVGRER